MAKRFTDTEKWKDDWFLELSDKDKTIWQYAMDNCSHAGILKKNVNHLNFCCKTTISVDNFFDLFKEKLIDMGEYFFIPEFLKTQYPKGLNSQMPAIVSAREEVFSLGLDLRVTELFGKGYLTLKDKDKDKNKDNRGGVGELSTGDKKYSSNRNSLGVHFCHNCEKYFNEKKYEDHIKTCRIATRTI